MAVRVNAEPHVPLTSTMHTRLAALKAARCLLERWFTTIGASMSLRMALRKAEPSADSRAAAATVVTAASVGCMLPLEEVTYSPTAGAEMRSARSSTMTSKPATKVHASGVRTITSSSMEVSDSDYLKAAPEHSTLLRILLLAHGVAVRP